MSEQLWLYDNGEGPLGPVGEAAIIEMSQTGALSPDGSVREFGPGGVWRPLSSWSPGGVRPPPPEAVGAWTDTSPHPWRRYWARMLDYAVLGGITWVLVAVVFFTLAPIDAENFFAFFANPGGQLLDLVCTVAAATPVIGILVGLTGTSVGKWFFGIKIVGSDGKPVGVLRGLQREIGAWAAGVGFGLPLISLIFCLMGYNRLQDDHTTSWDISARTKAFYRPEGTTQNLLTTLGIGMLILVRLYYMAAAQHK